MPLDAGSYIMPGNRAILIAKRMSKVSVLMIGVDLFRRTRSGRAISERPAAGAGSPFTDNDLPQVSLHGTFL